MSFLKVFTVSLGCPKNLVDTEHLLGQLGNSFEPTSKPESAQLILINTCAFIQPAIEESLEKIIATLEEVAHLTPKPLVVVTGCLVNRFGKKLFAELPEVDLWLSIAEQKNFASQLKKFFPQLNPSPISRLITTPSYGYLKISEGCNHKCSFCTIPQIRGKLHSFEPAKILDQAKQIMEQDKKELILIAQDLLSYGQDKKQEYGFIDLLEQLSELKFRWIRLLYLYPSKINERLLKTIASSKNILPYFDLPLQHSHPEILNRMQRPILNPQQTIDLIRKFIAEPVIRTTFIVGFPGEEQKHFNHLKKFILDNQFNYVALFPYWPEDSTPAAKLYPQLDSKTKQARFDQLMLIQQEITQRWLQTYLEQRLELLVDAPHPEWPTLYQARTWFQAPNIDGLTYLSGTHLSPGQMVKAEIIETKTYDLIALN